MSKKIMAGRYLTSTMLTGVAAIAAAPFTTALAQGDEEEEADRIVVTGSRIARQDLAAPSPVQSVDAVALVQTNTVNSEDFLNTLPQVIPAFDSASNNPGNGTATVSLRGLGTNRTLVLVDGMRFVGSGAGGPVDLNNIPAALIDRVDVVTGGASAVYGSDAVAGVVNFILKKDFEGVQLDVSDRLSAEGWDANIFNSALTVGGSFADGRGNAVFNASYTNREALLQGGRDFSEFTFFDPGAGNTASGFIPGGSGSIPQGIIRGGGLAPGSNTSRFGLPRAVFDAQFPECAPLPAGCNGVFNTGVANDIRGFRGAIGPDGYNYAPTNYLQLPQERYSIFGSATYEITDSIEIYARGVFANSIVDQQLAPTPFGFRAAVNKDNPLIPTETRNLLLGDPNSNPAGPVAGVPNSGATAFLFSFAKRGTELGTRNSLRDTATYQISGGIKVDLSDNWTWNTDAQFGRSSIAQVQTGNVSISAVREALLSTNGVTCTSGNPRCAAVNLFGGPGAISPAAAAFISRTGAQNDQVEQIQVITALNGDLGQFSPWAETPVGVVVGAEYREEYGNSIPDSVLGPDVLGFNQALPVGGRFDVYEAFMEADIPLIEGRTFFEELSINGAFRYSDYSIANVGSVISFAGGLEWSPVEDLRFRGQFQRAVRSPNIGELFAAFTNGFPGAQDPCSRAGVGLFGTYVPGNATLDARCIATGVPPAALGTAFQNNGQIEALFGGNANLNEETANTWTIGMVWEPTFLDGLTIQADYYNVKIRDAIAAVGTLPVVFNACYTQGIQAFCDIIVRDPASGAIQSPFLPNLSQANISDIIAKGIDVTLNYGFDLGELGSVSNSYFGSYTLSNGFTPNPVTSFVECAGLFAGSCGEPTPEYKHTLLTSWNLGAFTTSLRWRMISGVTADQAGLSDLSDDIGMYNYIDATLQFAAADNVDLTVGVQNITGKDAPILGSTSAEQANTWPSTYTTLGRQLFFGASVRF